MREEAVERLLGRRVLEAHEVHELVHGAHGLAAQRARRRQHRHVGAILLPAAVASALVLGCSMMGLRPLAEAPRSVSTASPRSIHSFTIAETVDLLRPVRPQGSWRLRG